MIIWLPLNLLLLPVHVAVLLGRLLAWLLVRAVAQSRSATTEGPAADPWRREPSTREA